MLPLNLSVIEHTHPRLAAGTRFDSGWALESATARIPDSAWQAWET